MNKTYTEQVVAGDTLLINGHSGQVAFKVQSHPTKHGHIAVGPRGEVLNINTRGAFDQVYIGSYKVIGRV